MDRLSNILDRFSVNANVFFSGNLCGVSAFEDEEEGHGHLHLLKAGSLTIKGDKGFEKVLTKPSVLYFPRPTRHRLFADESKGVELVCARVNYLNSNQNPLTKALPDFLHYELEGSELLGQSAVWLFDEAFHERCGRQPVVDRLCDIFVINVLRQVLEDGSIKAGMMAGLAHPQLSRLLVKLHGAPEQNWSLNSMAEQCGLSRSKFAQTFKEVIGQTPGDYLTDWRISVAQKLMVKKQGIDLVANHVGYENGSVLARVFRKRLGLSPKEWFNRYLEGKS